MSSLLALIRGRLTADHLLRLPAYCVPAANEPDYLRSKREAQLEWMRAKGVAYLGNPSARPARAAKAHGGDKAAVRLVKPS
jgi:hypothetical protein